VLTRSLLSTFFTVNLTQGEPQGQRGGPNLPLPRLRQVLGRGKSPRPRAPRRSRRVVASNTRIRPEQLDLESWCWCGMRYVTHPSRTILPACLCSAFLPALGSLFSIAGKGFLLALAGS
jgi:hypothetical protein